MSQTTSMTEDTNSRAVSRMAGWLYLVIIVCGVSGEALLRGPLIEAGDPGATLANLRSAVGLFRVSILFDVVMALSDVALAALLYVLLEPLGRTLSLTAMVFRLVQAAILGLNLLNLHRALALATGPVADAGAAQVANLLDAHAAGYDFGLFFFGVNCLLVGALLRRAEEVPRALGPLIAAAGVVYLGGSTLRVIEPAAAAMAEPAYALPLVAELWLCLWLLVKGVASQGLRRRQVPVD